MSQTPRLDEVIENAVNERLESFWTAMPVIVDRFDHATQRVTVRMTVANAVKDGSGRKWWHNPTIQNVPVLYPGSTFGGITYRITFPVGVGSNGLYIVSTLPTDGWRLTDKEVDLDLEPGSTNHLSSGFFIPADTKGHPTDAPVDAMVLFGRTIKLGSDTGTSPIATRATLEAFMEAIAPGHSLGTPVPLTDPAGAIAIIYGALRSAFWPENHVAAKAEAK